MAFGLRTLSATQIGQEATAGTAVAATTIWRGPVMFPEDDRTMEYPAEDVAIMGGTDRTNVTALKAKIAIPETNATYEQLPYLFNSIKALVTGVQDGAGTDYVYAFPFGTTAANTIKTFTIEGYDNTQEYESEYCFFQKIKLSGKSNEAVKMSAEGVGRQVTPSSKTNSLTMYSVNDINFMQGKLYIDAIGGTIGTTQKTLTWLGFELEINTGLVPVDSADGSLYFASHKQVGYEVKGKITIEHDATATAAFTAFQAQTPVLMQFKFAGATAFGTPGTTYTYPTLLCNMPIKWTKLPALGDENGDNVLEAEFTSRYNLTAAAAPSFTVVMERATLQ